MLCMGGGGGGGGGVRVPRPYIREERAWYKLLVHAPDLHGNPQKNVRYCNVIPWRPLAHV